MASGRRVAGITLKNPAEIDAMRRAGALVAETLQFLRERCRPGVTTAELDRLAYERVTAAGAIPSFLGYPGPTPFPGSICASVNDEIVHGIPGPRALRDGDIITIDLGAILDGWHGDAALTVPVGAPRAEALALLRDTEAALAAGIAAARAGNRLADVTAAIERRARQGGYGVVRHYGGHGIGREMHEPPHVPNLVDRAAGSGPILQPGMTFTIEPMFTTGDPATRVLPDRWTVVTADGSLAAHAEHLVAIVPGGGPPQILTRFG